MKNKAISFIKHNNLIEYNDSVLIGLSGGADSIFLSLVLLSIREEYNLTLKAAHIEHGIRGKDSINDCEFCKKFCEDNNIEFFEFHFDAVAESQKHKIGIEECSRNYRYEVFSSIDCNKIATAHNKTDNIETLIFRLCRGTSINGACSIPVKRNNIIRPLLNLSSKEIREYLNIQNIDYCIDKTNSDNSYSRNLIRNEVLPLLEKINSQYEENISNFINDLVTDRNYFDNILNCVDYSKPISILDLLDQHVTIRNKIIVSLLRYNNIEPNAHLVDDVNELLINNGQIQLSNSKYIKSYNGQLYVYTLKKDKNRYSIEYKLIDKEEVISSSSKYSFFIDADKVNGNLICRYRQSGDKITINGRNCTKSLKKLFIEEHIPSDERDSYPLICDDNGVIIVPKVCESLRTSIDDSTRNVYAINILLENI